MNSRPRNTLLRLLALFAALVFLGDIGADALADLSEGHCETSSSQSAPDHEKGSCSHCACAIHAGAVAIAGLATDPENDLQPVGLLPRAEATTPPRLAASIDHPPQLA